MLHYDIMRCSKEKERSRDSEQTFEDPSGVELRGLCGDMIILGLWRFEAFLYPSPQPFGLNALNPEP